MPGKQKGSQSRICGEKSCNISVKSQVSSAQGIVTLKPFFIMLLLSGGMYICAYVHFQ